VNHDSGEFVRFCPGITNEHLTTHAEVPYEREIYFARAGKLERQPQKLAASHNGENLCVCKCGYEIAWPGKVTFEAALVQDLNGADARPNNVLRKAKSNGLDFG
jgi:hypothetical protein